MTAAAIRSREERMAGTRSRKTGRIALVLGAALALASACSRGEEPNLVTFRTTQTGPDEFAILPTKPLQIPENIASLPEPTPGSANLTDPTPESDAIIALGGNPGTLSRRSGDGALVSYASRFGVAPGIRQVMAQEDLAFRSANDGRLLERLFDVTIYYKAYAPQSLDQHRELQRFRRAGIRTPSAPPEPIE